MQNNINNIAKHIEFRLIDEYDAEFILSLRLDPEKNRYISNTDENIDAQKEWIRSYKKREELKKEYYWIIEGERQERFGTIRIYDFKGDSFCCGSWIIKNGVPHYVSIESSLMVLEIGFNRLGFNKSHGEVRKANNSVLGYQLRLGAEITGEDDLNYHLIFTRNKYEELKKKFIRYYICLKKYAANKKYLI